MWHEGPTSSSGTRPDGTFEGNISWYYHNHSAGLHEAIEDGVRGRPAFLKLFEWTARACNWSVQEWAPTVAVRGGANRRTKHAGHGLG